MRRGLYCFEPWAIHLDEACAAAMGDEIKSANKDWIKDWASAPRELRSYSTDDAAARLLDDEIVRRGLTERYQRALLDLVVPEQKARAFLAVIASTNDTP